MCHHMNNLGKKKNTRTVKLGNLALNERDFRYLEVTEISKRYVASFTMLCIQYNIHLCENRLNFCINNGSRSIPSYVPIFDSDIIDQQMDTVCLRICNLFDNS